MLCRRISFDWGLKKDSISRRRRFQSFIFTRFFNKTTFFYLAIFFSWQPTIFFQPFALEKKLSPGKEEKNYDRLTRDVLNRAAVVAQRLIACLVTERSWVQIPPGAGLFSLLYPLSIVSSIQVPQGNATHFLLKLCLAVQLEA